MHREDRGAWLLSSAALPRIEIPRREAQQGAAPGAAGGESSTSDGGRFRERTLSWFSIGEALERDAPVEYEPEARLTLGARAALAVSAVITGVGLALWLA